MKTFSQRIRKIGNSQKTIELILNIDVIGTGLSFEYRFFRHHQQLVYKLKYRSVYERIRPSAYVRERYDQLHYEPKPSDLKTLRKNLLHSPKK